MQNSSSTSSPIEQRKSRAWTDALASNAPVKRLYFGTDQATENGADFVSKKWKSAPEIDSSPGTCGQAGKQESNRVLASIFQLAGGASSDCAEITDLGNDTAAGPRRPIADTIQDYVNESSAECKTWSIAFGKIENSELLNPARIDQLIDEAMQIEQRLLNEKEQLRHKLGILSSLLTDKTN